MIAMRAADEDEVQVPVPRESGIVSPDYSCSGIIKDPDTVGSSRIKARSRGQNSPVRAPSGVIVTN